MDKTKLTTACLGLDSRARHLLELADKTGLFEIVSVADSDMALAEKLSRKYRCSAFDDYRQFILQNDVDILFVSAPLYSCIEFIKSAICKKTHILKCIPTAADFEEAWELNVLAEKNGVRYLTVSPTRFSPGFERLCDHLKTVDSRQFYFVAVNVDPDDADCEDFFSDVEADPKLIGGGVLLNRCFEIIDEVVLNFSLPQQVYTMTTNKTPDKKARQYLGEDTVSLSLKFTGGLLGTFLAAKHLGAIAKPPLFQIYGAEQNITVTYDRLAVYDSGGELIEEHKSPYSIEKCVSEMLIDLARPLLWPDEYKSRFSSKLDLATMAVIESAYLSARTTMPEMPSRFFDIAAHENFPFA